MKKIKYIISIMLITGLFSQKILIPMDQEQNDHLKAYGIVHMIIKKESLLTGV